MVRLNVQYIVPGRQASLVTTALKILAVGLVLVSGLATLMTIIDLWQSAQLVSCCQIRLFDAEPTACTQQNLEYYPRPSAAVGSERLEKTASEDKEDASGKHEGHVISGRAHAESGYQCKDHETKDHGNGHDAGHQGRELLHCLEPDR